jgi:hypothetical protein
MNISIEQALKLYDELFRAYSKTNGFGGNEAEIYTYTLLPNSPAYHNWAKTKPGDLFYTDIIEMEHKAARSLIEIIEIFKSRNPCSVIIDEEPYDAWLEEVIANRNRFCHRVHVRVIADE